MTKVDRLLTAMCMAAALCGCSKKEQAEPLPPLVRLTAVAHSGGLATNSYPGKTEAAESSQVAFKVSGTIENVPVRAGQPVRRGDVLARMDSRDYETQLEATTAEYAQVKAECTRIIALYQDSGTTANNYDHARYGLEQITQKLRHAQDQVKDCVIRAPYDGYVQSVLHEAHETVSAGMPVVSLFSNRAIEIAIYIPVADYMRRKEFLSYTATFDIRPDYEYPLQLLSIAGKANANQLYEVRLRLDDARHEITPGMTTMVKIARSNTAQQQIVLPVTALFSDEEGKTSQVFVYDEATSCLKKETVEVVSISTDGKACITGDLPVGSQVVASGVHHLADGQRVRPVQAPSSTNVGGLL